MISKTNNFVPVLFGAGASAQVGEKAKELKITKAIVVCDQGVVKAGIAAKIFASLEAAGVEYCCFDRVQPDPPDVVVDEAGLFARAEKADGIIALGGGSSMDTAKGVNILLTNDPPINNWFPPNYPQTTPSPLICVPTSAGTGSEMTYAGVITDTKRGFKAGVGGKHCIASLAIVDPELFVGMPAGGTAACGFDAYAHAVDVICAVNYEPYAAIHAMEAVRLIHKHLVAAVKDGTNIEARTGMALASNLAGCAINTVMCHYTHAIGHTLGSAYHLPHGLCCGVAMPQLVRRYAKWMPDKVKQLAEAMGLKVPADITEEELGNITGDAMLKLLDDAGLPRLKDLGHPLEELHTYAGQMTKDLAAKYGPYPLSEEDFKDILTECYNQK